MLALLGCHSIAELGPRHVALVDSLGVQNPARRQIPLHEAPLHDARLREASPELEPAQ